MKILAIETSCDDTAVAVIDNFKVLSNIVSSQIEIHKKWGGVYPTLAKREHKNNLIFTLKEALKKSKNLNKKQKEEINIKKIKGIEKILNREPDLLGELIFFLKRYKKPKVNAIAITVGPGLSPCLWVGVNFAKALSFYWDIPIKPVNHIESHILVNLINLEKGKGKDKKYIDKIFPAICLIVSGGHTQLILMKKIGEYKIIGETRDDAAGECFDKTARIIGLQYPGGPLISKEALKLRKSKEKLKFNIILPRPMIHSNDYDFSFSGLKTAVLYKVKKDKKEEKKKRYVEEMALEIENAIVDVLLKKTLKAVKNFKAKTIIVGGGVSANKELRKRFKKEFKDINFLIPKNIYSTDNAVMIGITALFKKPKKWEDIKVDANLKIS